MKLVKKFALLYILTLFFPVDIYTQEYVFISNVFISGNSKTEESTISRELPFKKGDIVTLNRFDKLISEGRENILNLSLFNFVYVSYLLHEDESDSKYKTADIIINVEERWYYWPLLSFNLEERNLSSWFKEPDWRKVTFESGFKIFNIAGKNQSVTLLNISGHNRGLRFEYSNISLDKRGRHYLDLHLSRLYSRTENVKSFMNEPYYMRSDSTFLISNYKFSLGYTYRPRLRVRNIIGIDYEYSEIDKEILNNNSDYWGDNSINRRSLTVSYGLILDERDNRQYPLNGYYIDLLLKGYANSSLTVKYGQIKADIQYFKYISNKFNLALRVQGGVSVKNRRAYIFDRAIGYNDVNLRGYEFYVADGQCFATLSPTLRHIILPVKEYYLPFLWFLPKFNKIYFALYGKVFTDFGYAYHKYPENHNTLSNKLLSSWGGGLDVVTYYDITLSLDYSMNMLGNRGLYVSFKTPLK